jgi:putative heme degradation protein
MMNHPLNEVIQEASNHYSIHRQHHRKKTVASISNETGMILDVTVDLRISARRYGKALETPRCLAANGLLAL